ncbi:hypothetical protein LguiA_010809 [Lonicera macranthoides]
MALPKIFVLKSKYNNKYLQYVKEDVEVHGFNKLSGENLLSPYAKYEVEMAKTGDGLVHIKSCYNNKYFVRWSTHHWWIVAGADEPEEDKSKWSCTLFEILPMDGKMIRFRHVQLGHYACLWRLGSENVYDSCLFAGGEGIDKDQCDVFTVIDWESLCILPKNVCFMGCNGCYLGLCQIDGNPHLQFSSTDVDPATMNQIVTTGNGSVRIMSNQNNKFWRLTSTIDPYDNTSKNWICADSDDNTNNNPDTIFSPVKVDRNVIALKGSNNKFCKRFTTWNMKNCLSAKSESISEDERLEVKELAMSRNIYNVNYHLKDARIYHQSVDLLVARRTVFNRSKEPNTFDVKLAYTDSKSMAWNASVSPNWGVKTDIKASVPVIADGKVEINPDSTGVFEWGENIESSTISEPVYNVTASPMTQVKVNLFATQASCDIPFSYDQDDTLTNGTIETRTMDDGIYTCVNYYNFKYGIEEEKL